jgi:outer membrane immunogenic protein
MIKRIIGVFGIVALSSAAPAVASDFSAAPSYSGPMTAIAPYVYNWTGFYFGGQIGVGWADLATTEIAPGSGAFPVGTAFAENNLSGFLGGFQGGYNWQAGNFVFGIEGEYTWEDVKGHATTTSIPFPGVSSTIAAKASELGLATARIGYAASNWLYYFKGGGAWGHGSSIGATTVGGTPFDTTYTSTDRAGWVVGGGIEWGFAPNWSAMLEYNHVDFGSTNITIISSVSPTAFARSTETIDIIKAGINYRFNGSAF